MQNAAAPDVNKEEGALKVERAGLGELVRAVLGELPMCERGREGGDLRKLAVACLHEAGATHG